MMMFLDAMEINENDSVSEIVTRDYRTAAVFSKYQIEFCCGGRWPLLSICETRGLDVQKIKEELALSTHTVQLPSTVDFNSWKIDLLLDYIIQVHHEYLKKAIPETGARLEDFAKSHRTKYDYLTELQLYYHNLGTELLAGMQLEEEIIFPYIRQVTHAYNDKESYAALLVKTMRKPLEAAMKKGYTSTISHVENIRRITGTYSIPASACVTHRVVFLKLKELDNDLMQHLHLEQFILVPRTVKLQQELLQTNASA